MRAQVDRPEQSVGSKFWKKPDRMVNRAVFPQGANSRLTYSVLARTKSEKQARDTNSEHGQRTVSDYRDSKPN